MKKPRPAALPSITMQMPTRCGKIYVTVTVDECPRPQPASVIPLRFRLRSSSTALPKTGFPNCTVLPPAVSVALRAGKTKKTPEEEL